MTTPLSMRLQIRPAETTRVTLAAAAACSIAVRLIRYAFADSPALQANGTLSEAGGIGAATVEITNGRETWRAQTRPHR
jgi:hypothetical protein